MATKKNKFTFSGTGRSHNKAASAPRKNVSIEAPTPVAAKKPTFDEVFVAELEQQPVEQQAQILRKINSYFIREWAVQAEKLNTERVVCNRAIDILGQQGAQTLNEAEAAIKEYHSKQMEQMSGTIKNG